MKFANSQLDKSYRNVYAARRRAIEFRDLLRKRLPRDARGVIDGQFSVPSSHAGYLLQSARLLAQFKI